MDVRRFSNFVTWVAIVCGTAGALGTEPARQYRISDMPNDVLLTAFGEDYVGDEDVNKGTCPCDEGKGCVGMCDGKESDSCDTKDGCDSEPWRLFPEFDCGWKFYGWLNGSATANADSPASHYNGPVTFLDREVVTMNQAYAILERVADTGGCGWDVGGRVDLMHGSDYIFTQAAGWELHQNGTRHWNRSGNNYGLAMPQAYAEIAHNNLSLKLGHFYTIIGYQGVMATSNFFISQPYTFQYGEPFTHGGGLLTYKASDAVTLYGGVVNGWDKFDAVTDRMAFMGGINIAPEHGKYIIYLTGISGQEDGIAPPIQGTRSMYSLVFTYNLSDKLQYVLQHDNGLQENGVAAGADAEWYGLNHHLFYTINDCWKAGLRLEWFRDDDGARLASAPVRSGGLAAVGYPGVLPDDAAGNYYEFAVGMNWKPGTNLTVRPELRWDWSDNTVVAPYNDLQKDSQFIAAVDAIWLF